MSKFQFRKRLKLAPGISLSVSKKGLGISAGPKGLKASLSAQGRLTGSAGIPGSGLSYRNTLNSKKSKQADEFDDHSGSPSILENSAYIAIHGAVLSNKEMKKALFFLAASFIALITYILTALGNFGFLFNPFLFFYIWLTWSYIRESQKNKELSRLRKIEHLRDCSHFDND
jgi:hypothetical protein